ncbi:hypothetical protein ACLB2K_017080 [Fragaria x ananassa]
MWRTVEAVSLTVVRIGRAWFGHRRKQPGSDLVDNLEKKMESTIKSSLAFLFMGFALAYISLAQNNPQDYLNSHNAARAQVGVKPLTRSNSLAAYARQYA